MNMRVLALAGMLAAVPGLAAADNVVTYHNSITRQGAYKVPGLTLSAAANMHFDKKFKASVQGHIYAQPLFWHPAGGKAEVIVATESNNVYALDAATGAVVWQQNLGTPVPLSELTCGDIDPNGVTGTPVIDPAAGVLYLDAMEKTSSGPKHFVYALSLKDGTTLSGWPLDVAAALATQGVTFSALTQGERSGLQLYKGSLYVNFGGAYGDCLPYNGTVIQVQPSNASLVANWQTRANGGGIWAQGGIAGDNDSLFVTTGNTFGATNWSDGEAIIRLRPGLKHSMNKKDYFTPSNWKTLDQEDLDLGGTEALPLDVAVANGQPAKRIIAFGKDGNAYLADRLNLGGIGGALQVLKVSNNSIITGPAVYQTQSATMVAFTNAGGGKCSGSDITMISVAASGNSPLTVDWCASFGGAGSPIITTTDGSANAIVWVVGAEGDNELHGFNLQNGQVVFAGTNTQMSGLRHFETIMAAENRFYVAADNRLYAFAFK